MPKKLVLIPEIGHISVYKKRGVKRIRLSLGSDSSIRLTIPFWVPYKAGYEFARSRSKWINQNRYTKPLIQDGSIIGGIFSLRIIANKSKRYSSKFFDSKIIIRIPFGEDITSTLTQKKINDICKKALRAHAKKVLLPRLKALAAKHGYKYRHLNVKTMKSRWGSCNNHRDIVLNSYLVQMDPELIDYVIMHELVHTKIQSHEPAFWNLLGSHVSNLKEIRTRMKEIPPRLLIGD